MYFIDRWLTGGVNGLNANQLEVFEQLLRTAGVKSAKTFVPN